MASYSWRLVPEGAELAAVPHDEAAATISEANRFLPEGAYTTLRTYNRTGVIRLDDHFDRLEDTARLLGHPVRLERSAIRRLLCAVLRDQQWDDSFETRARLTVDCAERPGEVWISVEPLPAIPFDQMLNGVRVLTREMHRDNPLAKNSAFIRASEEARRLIDDRINEVLMVGPAGTVLEGLSSNFYGIREGVLYTADKGVLPGLTRRLVIEEVESAAIPIRYEAIAVKELPALDEAFLSSTSRGVMPVVEIDGHAVGGGRPGPLTGQIRERFDNRIRKEIEPLCG